jgi:hypothetical protein
MAFTPPYKIKNVETVVRGTDVQVRVFTLAPGESIPWHFHRESSDYYFVPFDLDPRTRIYENALSRPERQDHARNATPDSYSIWQFNEGWAHSIDDVIFQSRRSSVIFGVQDQQLLSHQRAYQCD